MTAELSPPCLPGDVHLQCAGAGVPFLKWDRPMGVATFTVNGAGSISLDENGVLSRLVDGDGSRWGETIATDLQFRKLVERAFTGAIDDSRPDGDRISTPRGGGLSMCTGTPAAGTKTTSAIRFLDRDARLVFELTADNVKSIDPREGLTKWMLCQLEGVQS